MFPNLSFFSAILYSVFNLILTKFRKSFKVGSACLEFASMNIKF